MGDCPPKAAQSSESSKVIGSKKLKPLYNDNCALETFKSIQERVAKSSLLLGNDDIFKKVTLTKKRVLNREDPLENIFHLAENQYLSVSGQYASPIESIDYVENRMLMEKFERTKNKFKSEGKFVKEYLLFHGTNYINIDSILKENFRMDYAGKHGQAYGRGIYFSAKTEIPNKYMNKGKRTLLLCRVLLGKVFHGQEKVIPEGFDSKSVQLDMHQPPCINIIKEVDQILPCFVLNLAPTDSPLAQPRKCKSCPMVFINEVALQSHWEHYHDDKKVNEVKKRLLNEFKRIQNDPPEGVTCAPEGDNGMLWKAVIFGPDDSVLQDGIFQLTLEFNGQYPYEPPVVKFVSQMFHPNIDGDTGLIKVRHLNLTMTNASMEGEESPLRNGLIDVVDNWSPARGVLDILMALRILLIEPKINYIYVVNYEAARLFAGIPQEYKRKVQESVEKSWSS